MLFLREDYPVTHALLDKFNISSQNAQGRNTIPNLIQLFDIILAKNKETFEFLVSFEDSAVFSKNKILLLGDADDIADITKVLSASCRQGSHEPVFQYRVPLPRG